MIIYCLLDENVCLCASVLFMLFASWGCVSVKYTTIGIITTNNSLLFFFYFVGFFYSSVTQRSKTVESYTQLRGKYCERTVACVLHTLSLPMDLF